MSRATPTPVITRNIPQLDTDAKQFFKHKICLLLIKIRFEILYFKNTIKLMPLKYIIVVGMKFGFRKMLMVFFF